MNGNERSATWRPAMLAATLLAVGPVARDNKGRVEQAAEELKK